MVAGTAPNELLKRTQSAVSFLRMALAHYHANVATRHLERC